MESAQPRSPHSLDELVAMSLMELHVVWDRLGHALLTHSEADFLRLFHLAQRADPHARASERMPNFDNWSLVGWVVMNVSDHNRCVIASVIVEAYDVLYRLITARELLDMIRGRT